MCAYHVRAGRQVVNWPFPLLSPVPWLLVGVGAGSAGALL